MCVCANGQVDFRLGDLRRMRDMDIQEGKSVWNRGIHHHRGSTYRVTLMELNKSQAATAKWSGHPMQRRSGVFPGVVRHGNTN